MIVDPADSFCDVTVCYATQGDVVYYFDDDHMSVAGAGVIAAAILRILGFPEERYVGAVGGRAGDAPVSAARPGR